MSSAPKFAIFGKTVPSKRRMVSLVQLPEVPLGRPDATKSDSAKGIASSDRMPQQLFRPRAPEEGMGRKSARRVQIKQANRGEEMGRFSYRVGQGFADEDAEPKAQTTRMQFRKADMPDRARLRERRKGESHQTNRETAKLIPQSESIPVWLTWLIQWQRRSSVITFLLVSATLAVYGGTVYTQQLWNREYRQLETLQLQQRQLTAASEVLKNQLAQQAEQQDTGLVPVTPNTNLFLQPAQQQSLPDPSSTPKSAAPGSNPQILPTPVGY